MSLAVGTQLGVYQITGQIGAGGMGEVYRATDTLLKRDVALKLLPPAFVEDADRLARFRREAEILAAFVHPNIAQVFGLEKSGGQTAIVMELIEGPSLDELIRAGPLPPDEAMRVATQIIAALEAAHDKNIVHRDLKPANVKLRNDGTVKVLDFGISKPVDATAISGGSQIATTPAMTQTGVILGTAAYMSPEQARGKPVDERTDIWAFGCLLFEMLTGQPAFGGEDVMLTLARVLDRDTDVSSMPDTISPTVRHTIALCLAKDPAKRIADIRDVRLSLQGRFALERPRDETEPALAPPWRSTVTHAAALTLGAAIALVVAVLFWPGNVVSVVSRLHLTIPADAPLATTSGVDLAISPDGRRVAYVVAANRDREFTLYLREIDRLEARPLATGRLTPDFDGINPFFSADGSWIGYRSPGVGIMRVDIEGGAPQKIIDEPADFYGGAVMRDGTLIYATGDALLSVTTGGGGTPLRLTPNPAPGIYVSPSLLPDERAVIFSLAGDRVGLLNLETRAESILIESGQNPAYLPSGHIVFARQPTLMAVRFDVNSFEVYGSPEVVLDGVRRGLAPDYATAANGTLIYAPATFDAMLSHVVWVDRAGQVLATLTAEPVSVARDPRLAPDEQSFVLTTEQRRDLWRYDVGGLPRSPIDLHERQSNYAIWSPDGSRFAYASDRDGSWDLFIKSASDPRSDPVPVRAERLDSAPGVWTEAGELIITVDNIGEETDIVAIDVEGDGPPREIVATLSKEYDPALSPNGRWLAYVSEQTDGAEIWVQEYPDGPPRRVSPAGGHEPIWAADGTELFYRNGAAMMAIPVETEGAFSFGRAVELFSVESLFWEASPWNNSYDVADDGRFLMLQQTGAAIQSSNLIVVQNWQQEISERMPVE